MKFRAERTALADAVSTAQRAVGSRTGGGPVATSGIKVTLGQGSVEFMGTDRELTIRVAVPAAVDGAGEAVLPARLFSDIIARVDADTVTVDFEGDDVKISAGRFSTELRTLPTGDFPVVAAPSGAGVTVTGAAFADALRQVVPAASKDDARPILTGVLLAAHGGGLRMVATDSYRLAMRDLQGFGEVAADRRPLVNGKALAEVQRITGDSDLEVVLDERDVTFRIGAVTVTSRLIEGAFPDYKDLIPDNYPNRLVISREALAGAVSRVRLVAQARDQAPISLAMSADGVELSARAQDVGEAQESVDATFTGTELKVAFNPQYLLDGLEAAGTEEVAIETIEPLKPAVLRGVGSEAEGFVYLLMPVRIP